MIKIQNPIEEHKLVAKAGEAMKNGQFVVISSTDLGQFVVTKATQTEKLEDVYVVFKEPLGREFADSQLNSIAQGDHVIIYKASGAVIEDDDLVNNSSADFTTATLGTDLIVSQNGFLTVSGAADDASAGAATAVADFIEYINGVVIYRLK